MSTTESARQGSDRRALEVSGVTKHYAGTLAVEEVSFNLEPGTFLTMLGPSGSGKTTTLNMIAGFLTPDAGSIRLGGRDLTHLPAHRRGIGMVFQNYALFPHLTALDNVAFPLEMRGVAKREARRKAGDALELVELGARGKQLPKQLSGGQQQRVALARAIVFEPDLLLMDEPLGALDKRLRETMQLEIMRISKNLGSTVVYVTHDQEEALVMSDLIAVYSGGRIAQMGTSRDLYEQPRSRFVADFIGESVMLACRREGSALIGDGWRAPVPLNDFAEKESDVLLVLRPECLMVEATGERAVGRIEGVVTETIYVGNAVKYIIAAAHGQTLEIRVDRSRQSGLLEPGQYVGVDWRDEDAILVSDDRQKHQSHDSTRAEPEGVSA